MTPLPSWGSSVLIIFLRWFPTSSFASPAPPSPISSHLSPSDWVTNSPTITVIISFACCSCCSAVPVGRFSLISPINPAHNCPCTLRTHSRKCPIFCSTLIPAWTFPLTEESAPAGPSTHPSLCMPLLSYSSFHGTQFSYAQFFPGSFLSILGNPQSFLPSTSAPLLMLHSRNSIPVLLMLFRFEATQQVVLSPDFISCFLPASTHSFFIPPSNFPTALLFLFNFSLSAQSFSPAIFLFQLFSELLPKFDQLFMTIISLRFPAFSHMIQAALKAWKVSPYNAVPCLLFVPAAWSFPSGWTPRWYRIHAIFGPKLISTIKNGEGVQ